MINFFFLARKLKNEPSPKFSSTATIEKRETDLGTSPRVARLIPRRAGSISSLYGAKTNLKAKEALFATSKKSPAYKTALGLSIG